MPTAASHAAALSQGQARSHHAPRLNAGRNRRRLVVAASQTSPFKVQLLHPVKVADADTRPLLVFLPGTDGTGQAITPQLPGLLAAGYDIRTLYIPPDDRSGWEQLQAQVLYLLAQTLAARQEGPHNVQVTLLAESFGGCLALRLAAAAPHLVKSMILLNPATCYNQSLNGLSSFVSATNLLGLFPQDLYNTAQAVLLPLLVDIDRVGPEGAAALRSMIFMEPPPDYETAGDQQMSDDPEQYTSMLPERRLIQANTSSSFTSAGPARQQQHNRLQAAGTAGLGDLFAGSSGSGAGARSGVFGPAAAANFRSNLLRSGNLPDAALRRIDTPTLVLSSAKDRMLPSLAEGARLARVLPRSRRAILPDSGHAALLEHGMDLATIMRGAGVTARPRRHRQHVQQPQPQLQQQPGQQPVAAPSAQQQPAAQAPTPAAAAAPAGTASTETVRVRLPDSSGNKPRKSRSSSMPRIIGVVKDDKALPGSRGTDGTPAHRPATLLPRTSKVAAAAAAEGAAVSSSSSSEAPQYTPLAAAGAAAAMAAATAGSGGAAATAAADAGGSSSLAQAAASSNGASGRSSSRAGSRSGSPEVQQQKAARAAAADRDLAWDEWSQILAPWRDIVSPVLLGQEHLPGLVGCNRPLLFVGNHQKMGLYDMPLLAYELYMRGFKVRGLAHPAHWGGPLGSFFEQFGAVPAGPMTAFKLLRNNEQVLLFPGGAKEVNKRVGQEYQLFWKESPDFVRLAARCGAIIVPFAAVGADDAYDVMMEADELLEVPVLGRLVEAALQRFDPNLDPSEAALPLTRIPGLGLPTPVPLPNLQRLYFKVCAPIDTTQLGLDVKKDAASWQALYDGIRATVYAGMEELQQVQAADGQRNVGARISKALQSWQPAFSITQSPPGAAGTDEEAAAAEAVRQGVALQKVSLDVDSLSSVSSLSSVASADEL